MPLTLFPDSIFTLTGHAFYDLLVNGERYTDYVVKGGAVEIKLAQEGSGREWIYGTTHTNIYGDFHKSLPAPSTPGTYRVSITVTDSTFVSPPRELIFQVEAPPDIPPRPPGPPVTPGEGENTGDWECIDDPDTDRNDCIWIPGSGGSGSVPLPDLWIFSEDIRFSNAHPAAGEETTVFAEIHYWAPRTDLPAEAVQINLYVTYPGKDPIKIGATLIDSLSVGAPDYGSRFVYAGWKHTQGEGIYIVEVEIDYSGQEAKPLNNAATRAIIVGQLGANLQGIVSGQVIDAEGGVEGVPMSVVDANGIFYGNTLTDPTGFYLVPGLPVGELWVNIDTPAGYTADAETKTATIVDQEETRVDFYLAVDNLPPELILPADIIVEATGPTGASVEYTVSATDAEDGELVPSCTPPSGITFALGDSTVSCEVSDTAGNTTSGSFQVTVVDTTPPVLTVPADIIVEATGPSGAVVAYTVSATDLVDGEITPICTPTSGSVFPLAVTTVTCSASDTAGNTASASVLVTVRDTTPPTITASVSPAANTYGWHNSPVTVSFTCHDSASGIASCSSAQTLGEGMDQSVSGTATDNAGNTAGTQVTDIHVDLTSPMVSVTGVSDGASYILGSVPVTGCVTIDALSGVHTDATSSVRGGDANGVGTFTATCSGALDNAGNAGAASVTYEVTGSPSGTPSAFSSLDVEQLRINRRFKTLFLIAKFALGETSDGIDLETDMLRFSVAGATMTIPGGSFRRWAAGLYVYWGRIDGMWIEALIAPTTDGRFGFQAWAYPVNLDVVANPVGFEIAIGDDSGNTSVDAVIR